MRHAADAEMLPSLLEHSLATPLGSNGCHNTSTLAQLMPPRVGAPTPLIKSGRNALFAGLLRCRSMHY
jgi:hypothetical protein